MPAARGCRVAKLFAVIVVVAVMSVTGAGRARADVPGVVDFQGTLTDGAGVPVTGQATMVFALYTTAAGGEPVWQETQAVTVSAGIYSTALGSVTPFPETLWENPALWLGIRQEGADELPQRVRIVAVPYALRAKTAESLAGGGSAVPAGAMVLSDKAADPALLNAGFVEVYSVRPECWRMASMTNAPTARQYHTAVWTGTHMIVWGGSSDDDTLDTGGVYDPVTDTWTSTSTVGAPSARYWHTAVWTGSRMIIWGGNGATGGVYDPVTDTWTPTSMDGAPDGRGLHTAVWTGDRMIVWGGGHLDTGGIYDPEADSWTPTSTANAPDGRIGHTAVWTGSRMIIWGGSFSRTGGVYDPATDCWTPTSTVGAPESLRSHAAVWTGDRMVIWGGTNSDTGGVYNPSTDTWTPTSTSGAPRRHERESAVAVWTGSGMLAWGGTNSNADSPDVGGTYDPVADAWTPIATQNAPHMRFGHTAVWTGTRLIVWGGQSGVPGYCVSSGGTYTPDQDHPLFGYLRP